MKHATKATIVIREDNPERNKIGVFKYIKRIIYPCGTIHYVRYRGYKWYVYFNTWYNGEPIYSLGGIKEL